MSTVPIVKAINSRPIQIASIDIIEQEDDGVGAHKRTDSTIIRAATMEQRSPDKSPSKKERKPTFHQNDSKSPDKQDSRHNSNLKVKGDSAIEPQVNDCGFSDDENWEKEKDSDEWDK